MRDEDEARSVNLILYFSRLYLTPADNTGTAGASVRLVHAADNR